MPQAVASVLGLREESGHSLQDTLIGYLRLKALLLVLDNCEHLLNACVEEAARLLRECPALRILATSRQALGITGEVVWRVPSLPVPDLERLPDRGRDILEMVSGYSAIQLFAERARAAERTFELTNENAASVARLCHHLDGIPLALELAAARVSVLTPKQIARRVDDRFRLLTGGNRAELPRQQTLRALVDWSYDLLSTAEKTLLDRLSVFAGGCTLEAAEVVCMGEGIEQWQVLDLLSHLVDKNLVLFEEEQGEGRYRLLETVRQYARERLLESGEAAQVRARHSDYFLQLVEAAEPQLRGPEQGRWLARLETEMSNLRTAQATFLADPQSGEAVLGLIAPLIWFWQMHGHVVEGRERAVAALAHPAGQPCSKARSGVLNGAGALAQMQGDYDAARGFCCASGANTAISG